MPYYEVIATTPSGATIQFCRETGDWVVCPEGADPKDATEGITLVRWLAELWFTRDEGGTLP